MYKNLNVAGLEPAPPGNQSGALTTEPYVLSKLRNASNIRRKVGNGVS